MCKVEKLVYQFHLFSFHILNWGVYVQSYKSQATVISVVWGEVHSMRDGSYCGLILAV